MLDVAIVGRFGDNEVRVKATAVRLAEMARAKADEAHVLVTAAKSEAGIRIAQHSANRADEAAMQVQELVLPRAAR